MTEDQLDNLDYLEKSLRYSGFGDQFDQAIKDGIEKGLSEIPTKQFWKLYNNDEHLMTWEPKIFENPDNPGRYLYLGYVATLIEEGKPDISQFISNYRMTGMTIDDSYAALAGGSVLHKDFDNNAATKKEAQITVFTRVDVNGPKMPRSDDHILNRVESKTKIPDDYKIIRVRARQVDIGKLYSLESRNLDSIQSDKERHLELLQKGLKVPVRLKEPVPGSDDKKVVNGFIQLHLKDQTTMALKIMDANEKTIREKTVPVLQANVTQTRGLNAGDKNLENIPEALRNRIMKSGPSLSGTVSGTAQQNNQATQTPQGNGTRKTGRAA